MMTEFDLRIRVEKNTAWPDDPQGYRRIRWLLKRMLRAAGLRCTSIRPTKSAADGAAGENICADCGRSDVKIQTRGDNRRQGEF